FHFHAALRVEAELYGDAILTTLPERLVKVGQLPGHPRFAGLEPRGALWVAIDIDGMDLQVINTHLGLVPLEQREQAKALAGPGGKGAPAPPRPERIPRAHRIADVEGGDQRRKSAQGLGNDRPQPAGAGLAQLVDPRPDAPLALDLLPQGSRLATQPMGEKLG